MNSIYGYFDDPAQVEPAYDPGLDADCPACNLPLSRPMVATSLMVPGDSRSYFWRAHKACYESLTPEQVTDIDSVLIDAVARTQQSN